MKQGVKREKERKKRGIFLKILTINTLFFVLPSLITFLIAVFWVQKDAERKISDAYTTILTQTDISLQNYLKDGETYMRAVEQNLRENGLLSKTNLLSTEGETSVKRRMEAIIETTGQLGGWENFQLSIITEGETYGMKTAKDEESSLADFKRLKDEEWFGKVMETKETQYIITTESKEYFTVSKQSALHIVSRLSDDKTGEFLGIIDLSIPKDGVTEILMSSSADQDQIIGWIDINGNLISSTGAVGEGKDHFSYSVTNSSTGFKTVMYEPGMSAGGIEIGNLLWIFLVAGLCIILLFWTTGKITLYIKEPVEDLISQIQRVSEGDFTARMEVKKEDELEEMSLQFNMMAEKMEENLKQIQRKEEESRILELQALQAQFHPSFLYRTLSSIRLLVEMGMDQRAGESLMALGRLIKSRISDSRNLITIDEEVHALEHYLILMNNQYKDGFDWTIEIEDDVLEYMIPRITIQPLVENSILHGFQHLMGKEKKGHVWVLGRMEKDKIILTIMDNGTRANFSKIKRILTNQAEKKDREKAGSIGIRQVQKRIHLYFGEEYGIQIDQSEYGGLAIEVILPKKKEMAVK